MTADISLPQQVGHPAPARGATSNASLWFGIFAAPTAWSVQTLLDFPMSAHSCYPALTPLAAPDWGGMWTVALLVSLAATGVGVTALFVAHRAWSRTRSEPRGAAAPGTDGRSRTGGADTPDGAASAAGPADVRWALDTGEGRTRFMAMSGILTSLVFVAGSLMHGLALFLVQPCGQ